jgi:ribosomal-protein-alanine N-acetyltransferase
MATIRPPADDLDLVMQVMERAFDPAYGEAWNRRQISDALVLPNCHCGLISAQGCAVSSAEDWPAGFYLSRSVLDEEELLLLGVDPAFRRRGLGSTLLTSFIDAASKRGVRRLHLEMRRNNPAARLYASHGFHPVGVRPGYYRTAAGPIDAISYAKLLP